MPFDSSSANELLTIAEVAEMLNVSATTVRRLQQGRHIPFHMVGRSVRFDIEDIVSYMAGNRVEAIG
jgi:excisionase family DNA binding protein